MVYHEPEEGPKPGRDIPEMDEEFFEQLRHDPRVIVHERTARKPFVSELRVAPGLDILELIGRRDARTMT